MQQLVMEMSSGPACGIIWSYVFLINFKGARFLQFKQSLLRIHADPLGTPPVLGFQLRVQKGLISIYFAMHEGCTISSGENLIENQESFSQLASGCGGVD